MQIDLEIGNILAVPSPPGCAEYLAQVIRRDRSIVLIAAFETTERNSRLDQPKLIAQTFDSLVKTGEWRIVGRQDPDPSIPIPVFKMPVSSEGVTYIQDLNGELRRPATADEAKHLFNPVTYSAVAFQRAVSQIASGERLDDRFAPMLPNWEFCEQTLLTAST